tara:strand:- start:2890 stop:3201 length:312 start_codon:yes stop_codon:yes gene_type:complete
VTESNYICRECGGDHIGWDALADENGEIICQYDHHECLDCELENTAIERPKQEATAQALEMAEAQRRIDAGEPFSTTAAEMGLTPAELSEMLAIERPQQEDAA